MNSRLWVAAVTIAGVAAAQDIPLNLLESLGPKAAETVQVNLDGSLLQMAAKFLNDKDGDEAKVKNLLNGLKGIYVRSYKFEKAGEYSTADIDKMRAQLKGWNEIVTVRSAKENTGIYLKTDGQKVQGLVVLAAEPMELTVVNIVGTIQPEQLAELSGKFGIPDLGDAAKKAGSQKKKEEE
jgi:uncharacterized protein DUF4252